MSSRLTMAREGTLYSRGDVSISWPFAGRREVVEAPDPLPQALRMAIAQGFVVETNLPVTGSLDVKVPIPRVLEGAEAKAVFEEPAGPVVRTVHKQVVTSTQTTEVPVSASPNDGRRKRKADLSATES